MTDKKLTKRRDFIKGMGVVATGIAATGALPGCGKESSPGTDACDCGVPSAPTAGGQAPPDCPPTTPGTAGTAGAQTPGTAGAAPAATPDGGPGVTLDAGTATPPPPPPPPPGTPDAGQVTPPDTPTATPTPLPDNWDREADVIVVGTGFAGLTTAIVAYDAGASVLILEKMPQATEGGNSKVSGNMWWTPANEQEGIEYIKAMCYGLTDDECIEALVNEMSTLNDWLGATVGINASPLGIFQPEYPELPGSGSVRTWSGGLTSLFGGSALWTPLREGVTRRGIEVLYETSAEDLLQDGASGEIRGMQATRGGETINIRANKAVVLACGGFEFDFAMQSQFLPGWPVYGTGSPGNTGDGVKMAKKVGADLWHMNNALAHLGGMVVPDFDPVAIPVSFPGMGYILVNKFGERFMDERRPERHGFGHKEILFWFDGLRQTFPHLPCYGVFDEATRLAGPLASGRAGFGWFNTHNNYTWSRDNSAELDKGWIQTGSTLTALAQTLGMDGRTLEATVDQYNQYCQNNNDLSFGRTSTSLQALTTPPYYAVEIYPIMYNTQGGPRRNAHCQIVNPDGEAIPRLYSAGELGSFWGWMYNGGGNNAECLCTGRIAGRNCAAEPSWV